MMKLFLLLTVLFCVSSNLLAQECDIKITQKEYPLLTSATFPVVTLTDLKLKVEQPTSFGVSQSPIIFFDKDKMIGFSYKEDITSSQSKADLFYLRLFGLLPLGDDITAVQEMRKKERLCSTTLTEIKLTSTEFMAFMRPLDGDFINVYIIPVKRKGFIYTTTFKGYSEKTVGGIISSIE